MFEVVTLKEGKTVCLTTYVGLVTLCVWGGSVEGCMHLYIKD